MLSTLARRDGVYLSINGVDIMQKLTLSGQLQTIMQHSGEVIFSNSVTSSDGIN